MTLRWSRACPECGERFSTDKVDKLFCQPAHKAAFANRNSARGRGGLVQAALAWRASRNRRADPEAKAVGQAAFGQLCRLLDDMLREDRADGRDAIAYVRAGYRRDGLIPANLPVSLPQPKPAKTAQRRPTARRVSPKKSTQAAPGPISLNQRVVGSNPTSPTIVVWLPR